MNIVMNDHPSSFVYFHHDHFSSPHNSFHMYEQLINNNNNNTYNVSIGHPSTGLSPLPLPVCINSSTPLKELVNINICQSYDFSSVGRRRRPRTVFTESNIQKLDSVFVYNQYPDIELRETLAAQMGVCESRIQVWFKNRRTRARTAQRQQLKMFES